MILKLNTNLVDFFSGCYETQWEPQEIEDNGDELEVDYKFTDLMRSIIRAYQGKADYILSELNCDFIKSLKFTGKWQSPREYNFSTDTISFNVNIDKKKMIGALDKLKDDQNFKKFLIDNYRSYDGFWSWTPDNYEDIRHHAIYGGEGQDQSIGALISYLSRDNRLADGGCSIEDMVYEDWQGNGYGGLDYKVVNN